MNTSTLEHTSTHTQPKPSLGQAQTLAGTSTKSSTQPATARSLRVKIGLSLMIALGALSACQSEKARVQTTIEGFAQGGTYRVVVIADSSREHLKGQIDSLLEVIDASVSTYNPSSRLSRINRGETDTLDQLLIDCIQQAQQLSHQSQGRYDITIKPLISAYGFAENKVTQSPNIDSLMQLVGYHKISIEGTRLRKAQPNIQIDLNSIAQGAAVDRVAALLQAQGETDFLVEIGGGEIFCQGLNAKGNPWRVGIDKPIEGNIIPGAELQVRLGVSGIGMATSGNYRKFYTDSTGRKIVHTVDARTGQPVISNLLSATVIAPNCTQADAYGTLCMVLGLDQSLEMLEKHPKLQAYLIWSDESGTLHSSMTPGLEKMILPQP